MEKKHAVIDNAAEKRYELDLGKGDMALIEYAMGDGFVVLTHTEVPPAYEGQGIGKELVLAALEDIRSKGLRVVPQCSFVEVYIRRHPEWADLVRTAESAKR
ncbi:GNAT family N-acetyltransferase [Alistipes senegalensis]|uniref:GNAT family N-acetyltransferase n=1 Tax=Alistipes senegalensis TaxID=1288121 RepID=UPI00189A768A|nr:GNAT family N-acetyltransferase [Alistipes senegalensis]MBD9301369.1 N-acetyltransferase [Alistipes senegalensis]